MTDRLDDQLPQDSTDIPERVSLRGKGWQIMRGEAAPETYPPASDLSDSGLDVHGESLRVGGESLERPAGFGDAMGVPRVLADEHPHLGVFEVGADPTTQHAIVDPELASLLLRESGGTKS